MSELDTSGHFVRREAGDAVVHQLASKSEHGTEQTPLRRSYGPGRRDFIRSDASTAINRPSCVRFPFRSGGFCLVRFLIKPARTTVCVVVVETAVGIVTLNQTTRGRVIFCRRQ